VAPGSVVPSPARWLPRATGSLSSVAVLGRRPDVLEEVAREIGGVAIAADLSRPSDVARAATQVVETLGTVDALVLTERRR
jgi:NADP-dependent 3-hydroxy acid dehydrogenase YdfG